MLVDIEFLAGICVGITWKAMARLVRFGWFEMKARATRTKTTAEVESLRKDMHDKAKDAVTSVIDFSLLRADSLDKAFNGFANAIVDHHRKLQEENPKNAITPEGVAALAAVSTALIRELWLHATLAGHTPLTDMGKPPSELN